MTELLLRWWLRRNFTDENDRLAMRSLIEMPVREQLAVVRVVKRWKQDKVTYPSMLSPVEREAIAMWNARLVLSGWKRPEDR